MLTFKSSAAQQIDNTTQQTNKPQNKRGRKPLSSMPTTKKHIQNLTNQRAFRQRRETYIRSLESKASRFEGLLKVARNEVDSLKERVALLEVQVEIEERINICNGVNDLQTTTTTISDENIRINRNDNNINSFNDDNNKINDDDNNSSSLNGVQYNSNTSCCGDQSSQISSCFTPFTTTNTPPFSFNNQHRLINPPQMPCSVPMLPPLENVDDVTRDPIFCEPDEDLVNEQRTTITTGILSTTIPSSLHSNYSPNASHWELPHQQDYFSPATSSVVHPLHLKWILSDPDNKYI
ncbi:hypothetical protein C1645_387920 [Glomus cerebriforme]|uniref:BZIP domain-containing protein n=1 Tax=Glomus cerebriforme TaxID=658196 RepID=A0A397SJP6_9GLOM|nr:hypothetical protein C1645_387920 [Glomus cerebriforme]